jgi:predicted Zn-dependent protease
VARYLARRHVSRAERLLAAGDEGTAASELIFALESDPLHPAARRLLCELNLRRHSFEEAFLCLQSYTDAFPNDPAGWSDLAEVRLQAAQLDEAEAALTNAIDRAPDRVDLLLRRADLRYRKGRYHGALLDAQAVLQRDAGVARALAILGDATKRLAELDCRPTALAPLHGEAEAWPGQLGAIIRDFRAATRRKDWTAAGALVRGARERYPHTMLGPWLDGVSSLTFGDTDNAERLLREALEVSPRSHRPITNLVALWSRQRGAAYSGDQLLRLVKRDPAFAYPLPIAAGAYVEADQPARAEAAIRRMFEVVPVSPVPYREVAKFLLQLDRASDAIATVNDGLARFPRNADLLVEQARAYAALGDREAAIRAYGAALSARPDEQRAAAQLARLLVTVRKDASSHARALQIVRDLECDAPSDSDVLFAIGVVLLQGGNDPRRARAWLEAARDREPDSPQVRYQLALAYARGQDVTGARRELQEALRSGGTFDEEPEARRLLHELGDGGR